jgi:phosphohistidine phosphatase
MILYLLRHAEAEPHCPDDFSRRLTEKGIKQADRVGCFMKDHCERPDFILTSPVIRAHETAGIVANHLGKCDVTLSPWAACGMDPKNAIHEIATYNKFKSILLVGHEPDFSVLIAALIGLARSPSIQVGKASLISINLPRLQFGSGILQFVLPVKFF